MGSWGYKATENDDYADTTAEMTAPTMRAITKRLKQKVTLRSINYEANNWRAAALLLIRLKDLYIELGDQEQWIEDADAAIKKLSVALLTDPWMETWSDRRKATVEIGSEIEALQRVRSEMSRKPKSPRRPPGSRPGVFENPR